MVKPDKFKIPPKKLNFQLNWGLGRPNVVYGTLIALVISGFTFPLSPRV